MTKISERFEYDELTGQSTLIQTYDVEPVIESVPIVRDVGVTPMSDSKHVARIPPALATQWAQEAGIDFSTPDSWDKMREVIHRKILSGDFEKLRPWTGSYKWDT